MEEGQIMDGGIICHNYNVTVADEKTDGKNRKKKKNVTHGSIMVDQRVKKATKPTLTLFQHSSCINVKPGLCHFTCVA